MEGWRTGRELIVKDRRGKRGREGKFFKNVGDSGEDRCEKTMSGEKNVWMHVKCKKKKKKRNGGSYRRRKG